MYDLGRAPGMATGAHLFSGGNMERLEWIKDEEVVFCPSSALDRLTRFRGASGMICGRQVGKSWGKKKAKSVRTLFNSVQVSSDSTNISSAHISISLLASSVSIVIGEIGVITTSLRLSL